MKSNYTKKVKRGLHGSGLAQHLGAGRGQAWSLYERGPVTVCYVGWCDRYIDLDRVECIA